MDSLIASFPAQLDEGLEIGRNARLTRHNEEIRNVVVSGLGGSGIGGDLVAAVCSGLKVPFIVNKGYSAPAFIDQHSLVIISSYSGNTEETLRVMEAVQGSGAKICCVSSNGEVQKRAEAAGFDFIELPGGKPPRACLGYSFLQQLFILAAQGLIDGSFESQVERSIAQLNARQDAVRSEARELAGFLRGKIPVIYCEDRIEAVAVRFRQQINENSKMLCWHHVLPEMNHNELVGWTEAQPNVAVLWLRNGDDFARVQQRMELNKEVMGRYAPIRELHSEGESLLEKSLHLIHVCDWASFFLTEGREVDPVEVRVIDQLKGALAEMPW